MKRSNAPIFWSLFGAGGVLSALCGPILALIIGIAVPLGISLPPQALGYARMSAFVHTLFGKAFLFAIISLFLWHAAHRIYHCLHDFDVHPGLATKIVLYGSAAAGTASAAWLMLAIGR